MLSCAVSVSSCVDGMGSGCFIFSASSCADEAVPGRLTFTTSSWATLFRRLCLLPTRLIRRIPPMNRRPPFSSSGGGLSGGGILCASLECPSNVSRVVVELFFARWTSSTLADADRCFELARLLGVVGRRCRPSPYETCRGTAGGRVLQLEPEDDAATETCMDVGLLGVPPNSSVDAGTALPSAASSRSFGSVESVPSFACACTPRLLRLRGDGEPGSRS